MQPWYKKIHQDARIGYNLHNIDNKTTCYSFFKAIPETETFQEKVEENARTWSRKQRRRRQTPLVLWWFLSLSSQKQLVWLIIMSLSFSLFSLSFTPSSLKSAQKKKTFLFYNSLSGLRLTRRRVSVCASLLWLPLSSSWEKMDLLCLMELIMAI